VHRGVDKVVLAANSSPGVRTAIVGPPTIYGPGRGPVNQRSIQVYDMAKYLLQNGYAPILGAGKAEWDNVHMHDLAALFVLLVDATQDGSKNSNPDILGPRGYFFLEHGAHLWSDVARWIAEAAYRQGFVAEPRTEATTVEGATSWGRNSKSVAERASKYLGWKPRGRSLRDEIPDILAGEAARLGIKPTGNKL